MNPNELLAPILIASIVVAVVLFVTTFFRFVDRSDPLASTPPSDPSDPQEDESDGWFFVKFEPPEQPADLSPP
ncbi:MAG: hypothetical protein P8125_00775 [Gemmatimonadota bacterium]|jgi:hypothetical protein